MTTTPDYVYSYDEMSDSWHDDIENAMDDLVCNADAPIIPGGRVTLYRGEKSKYTHGAFVNVQHDVIENMRENAWNEAGERADDYLDDITDAQKSDLARVITEWLNAHAEQPRFYAVNNIVPVTVTLEAKGEYASHEVTPC